MNNALILYFAAWASVAADAYQPVPDVRVAEIHSGSYLGIGVQEIDSARAKALGLREERGVEVTRVADASPASKAGVKTGDVVLEYNGQRVEGVEQFMRIVRETPVGREVRVVASRSGGNQQFTLTTAARRVTPLSLEVGAIPSFAIPAISFPDLPRTHMSWRSAPLGFDAEALDSQLAEFFGVKEGVLVRSISKGSTADKAGLKAGDVIVRVEDSKVSSPREITQALRSARAKRSIAFGVVREKREMPVQILLEE